VPSSSVKKSIASYVSCTGLTDDSAGVAKAITAAANSAFTLVIDCPVTIKIGSDISRPIFIGNDTSIEFTGSGKFIVDNVMIPAFVIADSSNISLINWNVEYAASIPVVQMQTYDNAGQTSTGMPGNAFNDIRLTQWLAANRDIVFSKADGAVMAQWSGTTNMTGVFYITGDVNNVNFTGMNMYVAKTAGGSQFMPAAFSLAMNFKRGQSVTAKTPTTAQYRAVPNNVNFTDVTLDGTYMGFVGEVQNGVFQNITSQRYGDLQDASGNNVGGVNKWFAPPHLFYFTYNLAGDSKLYNSNITIEDVTDNGVRVGKARDLGGSDSISGYANSLKLGCVNCSVNNYLSARPDGLMDILNVNGLTVSNVTGTYDSSFTNNLYPGWRFPASSYQNVKFENVSLTDVSARSMEGPIGNAALSSNQGILMSNVQVALNQWGLSGAPFPTIAGSDITVNLNYAMLDNSSLSLKSQTGSLQVQLDAMPVTLKAGQSTKLTWQAWSANSCSGSGPWNGALGTNGSQSVKFASKGVYEFSITCRNAGGSTTATAVVDVTS
jgi:hypothetical protein